MVNNHHQIIPLAVVALMATMTCSAQSYPTRLLEHEQQIETLIKDMTLDEKIAMLHGKNMFSSAGVPRLGIADMEYADGPFGIREEMEPHSWNPLHLETDYATFFPTGSALAATWSTEWAYNYGRGMSHWGSLFLVYFLTSLFIVLAGMIIMLPAHILYLANYRAQMGVLIGDPLGMPSYMLPMTFVTFVLCSFLYFYSCLPLLINGYYAYGAIEAKELEHEQQKLDLV